MPEEVFDAGQAALFVQLYGPNTEPLFLGCHSFLEVTESNGERTLKYQPDPIYPGEFFPKGSWRGAPSAPGGQIMMGMRKTRDYLERLGKRTAPIHVNKPICPPRSRFTNYERSWVIAEGSINTKTRSGQAARNWDDMAESTFTLDLTGEYLLDYFEITAGRLTTTETEAGNDMVMIPSWECKKNPDEWQYGFIGCDAAAGLTANVLQTTDGGTTWAATATDPFAADENIMAIVAFPAAKNIWRLLCVRDGDVAAPLEVGYSDDWGATWTNVTVGATNNEAATGARALFALDYHHIWLVTDAGNVFFSDDGGASWTDQGALTASGANPLNGVHSRDGIKVVAVGDTDTIIVSENGGTTWTAGVATGGGDNLLCCELSDEDRIWAGADEGGGGQTWYYSEDTALTWATRDVVGVAMTAGEVKSVHFLDPLCGFMVHNTVGPVGTVSRTRDGGYTWEVIGTIPTNVGINRVFACTPNLAFVCGEPQGALCLIAKITDGSE